MYYEVHNETTVMYIYNSIRKPYVETAEIVKT